MERVFTELVGCVGLVQAMSRVPTVDLMDTFRCWLGFFCVFRSCGGHEYQVFFGA